MNHEQSFDINLLNPEIRGSGQTRLWQSKTIYLLIIGLIVVSWLGAWGWYALRERHQKTEIANLQAKADLAASDQRIESQTAALRKTLAIKQADVQEIEGNLILCSEVLTQIETALPMGTHLTEISANGDELTCKGVAADYATLATFILSAGKRKNLTEARCIMAETTDTGVRFEVLFKLACK